ncbi:hypothetical protein [Phytohabitans rumicis]|uniref:hypothetical protein n=1 Tax=Phytohabitans rumicis TaxID=1076125 RepID=UPI0031EA4A04
MVIEQPGRDRVWWVRAGIAAVTALAGLGAAGALWEYGRRAGAAAPDVSGVVFVATGVHIAATQWERRRRRTADLRWRPALVVRGGVLAGLHARVLRRTLALRAFGVITLVSGGLVFAGGEVGAGKTWSGVIGSTIAGGTALALAVITCKDFRLSGGVSVTAGGVVLNGRVLPWDRIGSVERDEEGIHLRLRPPGYPRTVEISDSDSAVPDERVAEVIEFYLANPHRRSALGTGPDRLALPSTNV